MRRRCSSRASARRWVAWPRDFCEMLVAARLSRRALRQPRQVGRSTHVHGAPPTTPSFCPARGAPRTNSWQTWPTTRPVCSPPSDPPAHRQGIHGRDDRPGRPPSRYRRAMLSLTSIMSTTGRLRDRRGASSTPWSRPPPAHAAYIRSSSCLLAAIGSPAFPREEPLELRDLGALSFDPRPRLAGPGRQLAAIIASGEHRTRKLSISRVPALGLSTASADFGSAPRADAPPWALFLRDQGRQADEGGGMGHDLSAGTVWPQLIEGIVENAARAGGPRIATPPLPASRMPLPGSPSS